MNLPPEVSRLLTAASAQEIRTCVRALYDLQGNLGETWAISDGAHLFLLSKRIGEEFRLTDLALDTIDEFNVRDDGAFAYVQVRAAGREENLKFSIWDRKQLDALSDCWTEVSGRIASEGTRFLQLEPVGTAHHPPVSLTPLTAFCAAVHAMIMADGVADASELFVLQTAVKDAGSIERGRLWLEQNGEEALLKKMFGMFNDEQKLCLLANVAAVGMADGLWRRKEQSWLDRLQRLFAVSDQDFQPIFDILMVQNGLNVFESDSAAHAGPTAPFTLFAANLQAIAGADGEVGRDEQTLLWQLIDDPDVSAEAAALLERDGLETVMRHSAMTLNDAQKHCLLANLLKVAMVDGVLRSTEQTMLERFRLELGVPDGTWQSIHYGLMVKNNLTVFAV